MSKSERLCWKSPTDSLSLWCSSVQVLSYGFPLSQYCDSLHLVPGAEPAAVQSANQLIFTWFSPPVSSPHSSGGSRQVSQSETSVFCIISNVLYEPGISECLPSIMCTLIGLHMKGKVAFFFFCTKVCLIFFFPYHQKKCSWYRCRWIFGVVCQLWHLNHSTIYSICVSGLSTLQSDSS